MTLTCDIRHRQGAFQLDARFDAGPGITALFGRSGSGKTTIVNVIAGLIAPTHGRVTVDDVLLVDTQAHVLVPAHKRRIGYVFQDARLFPHLTVRQNLLYGRWFAPEIAQPINVDDVIALLGLDGLLMRKPDGLSGGEKQRVAIGRALLANPRLLLLDEPLASLDDARKQEILPYLERLRDAHAIPMVYVSHALDEVVRLATSLVVLDAGRVVATGLVGDVLQRTDLTPMIGARDAGALIEATVSAHDMDYGLSVLASRAGTWRVPRMEAAIGSRVRLRVRASDVMIATAMPDGISALNAFEGVVDDIGPPDGAGVQVRLDCRGDRLLVRLTRYSLDRLELVRGTPVLALIKAVAVDDSRRRL
jgi:molybdate transport system ATP-binding protein